LNIWVVIVLFAGIDNDLFYEPNTSMLFADAKQAAADIASEISDL
jgi:NAD/NADP transhydrogenase beta subunit